MHGHSGLLLDSCSFVLVCFEVLGMGHTSHECSMIQAPALTAGFLVSHKRLEDGLDIHCGRKDISYFYLKSIYITHMHTCFLRQGFFVYPWRCPGT